VDRHVVGLVAPDEILRLVFRGMMDVALEGNVRSDFLENDAPNPAGFRIPRYVIAPLERLRQFDLPLADLNAGCWTQ
jgi:hypothetical protein